MQVTVLFNPNRGQRLPKIWLCCNATNQVAHGSIGSGLSLKSVKANVRETFSSKLSSGYWDLGEIVVNDDDDLLALTRSLLEMHRCGAPGVVTVDSRFEEVVLNLRRWSTYRCRIDFVGGNTSAGPVPVLTPRSFDGPIVSDTSDSWF